MPKQVVRAPTALVILSVMLVVVFAAGCVGQIPGLPGFGSDVIKPSRSEQAIGVADVVAIEGVQTLPASPILPDQGIKLFMNIVSRDTDPLKPIQNVFLDLYDASVFKTTGGRSCNVITCLPQGGKCVKSNPCELQAGGTTPIIYDLKAPSAGEIAYIITRGTLSWLLNYGYQSKSTYDVLLVSQDEIVRLQQLGQTLSVPVQTVQSSGPLKIDISMPTTFAITSSDASSRPNMFVTFKLRNAGSGFPVGNSIDEGELRVVVPRFLGTVDTQASTGFIQSTTDTQTGEPSYVYNKEIPFFKKETTPMQLVITPAVLPEGTPHRTFTITASVDYKYELRGMTTVEVRPPSTGG